MKSETEWACPVPAAGNCGMETGNTLLSRTMKNTPPNEAALRGDLTQDCVTTTVLVPRDLKAQAKDAGINMSETLREALVEKLTALEVL